MTKRKKNMAPAGRSKVFRVFKTELGFGVKSVGFNEKFSRTPPRRLLEHTHPYPL